MLSELYIFFVKTNTTVVRSSNPLSRWLHIKIENKKKSTNLHCRLYLWKKFDAIKNKNEHKRRNKKSKKQKEINKKTQPKNWKMKKKEKKTEK